MSLGPCLLLGDQALHRAYLDSVGRRRATGVHKLGAQYAVPLRTNADERARLVWSHARVKVGYKSRMLAICAQIDPNANIRRKSIVCCDSYDRDCRRSRDPSFGPSGGVGCDHATVALLALLFWPFYKTMEVSGSFSLVVMNPASEKQFAFVADEILARKHL